MGWQKCCCCGCGWAACNASFCAQPCVCFQSCTIVNCIVNFLQSKKWLPTAAKQKEKEKRKKEKREEKNNLLFAVCSHSLSVDFLSRSHTLNTRTNPTTAITMSDYSDDEEPQFTIGVCCIVCVCASALCVCVQLCVCSCLPAHFAVCLLADVRRRSSPRH